MLFALKFLAPIRNLAWAALMLALLAGWASTARAQAAQAPAAGTPAAEAQTTQQITWDDLLPEGWMPPAAAIDHFFDLPAAPAMAAADAPVVPAMNGRRVKLPGYLVPIDLDGQNIRSFLMVPYFGACIHVPPPPPNQVVFVTLATPVRLDDPYGAHWVSGVLSTELSTTELAEAAYTMQGELIEVFDWDALYQQSTGE